MRGSLWKRLRIVEQIIDSGETSSADKLRGIDLLARYGVGQPRTLNADDIRERLLTTVSFIRDALSPEQADELIQKIAGVWR